MYKETIETLRRDPDHLAKGETDLQVVIKLLITQYLFLWEQFSYKEQSNIILELSKLWENEA